MTTNQGSKMHTTTFLFKAKRMSLTYGKLPTLTQFREMWFGDVGPDRTYEVRNCKRVGDRSFVKPDELYSELCAAVDEWQSPIARACGQADSATSDEAGKWASCVLSTFGVEWI